ncbi:protease complex subunit PrcB family protein [Desulfosarcina sp.]|uniref:protease complex subunit PrcB family protein n=1 Tax=Desulfosarcina sp. TaxID=2027861 RepID=UPI0029BBC18B|nr:protease complex subunit PrcB family protein [Desulfosarcina sp.]MDX2451282.1 protease complex subunit PrcB family protein [Desulfosarcina sp.]
MHHKRFFTLLLALNLMLGACTHSSQTAPGKVPLTAIHSGRQMVAVSKTLGGMWITNEDQLAALIDQAAWGTMIPAKPIALPEIDFAASGVLVVWMGEMPSGGYALELMAEAAKVENRTALVPLRWIEPEKGLLTTQIITHPYLMVRMGKGNYDTITVIDPNGLIKILVDVHGK